MCLCVYSKSTYITVTWPYYGHMTPPPSWRRSCDSMAPKSKRLQFGIVCQQGRGVFFLLSWRAWTLTWTKSEYTIVNAALNVDLYTHLRLNQDADIYWVLSYQKEYCQQTPVYRNRMFLYLWCGSVGVKRQQPSCVMKAKYFRCYQVAKAKSEPTLNLNGLGGPGEPSHWCTTVARHMRETHHKYSSIIHIFLNYLLYVFATELARGHLSADLWCVPLLIEGAVWQLGIHGDVDVCSMHCKMHAAMWTLLTWFWLWKPAGNYH